MMPTVTSRADYDSRRRRRVFLRAAISLALGIAVTFAVSWMCALCSPLRGGGPVATTSAPASVSAAEVQSLLPSYVFAMRGFGVRGTNFIETFSGLDSSGNSYTNRSPVDHRMAFGWPMPALGYRLIRSPNRPSSLLITPTQIEMMEQQPYWLIGGISGLNGASWRGLPERHLPLTPRFAGLFINSLIAGLPIYILIGGWADIRVLARARKGRCAQCGYDARELPTCPECGLEAPRTLWARIREFMSGEDRHSLPFVPEAS